MIVPALLLWPGLWADMRVWRGNSSEVWTYVRFLRRAYTRTSKIGTFEGGAQEARFTTPPSQMKREN